VSGGNSELEITWTVELQILIQTFYTSTGAKDANEKDIILLDAGKLPRKENFNNKKDFDNEARKLIS